MKIILYLFTLIALSCCSKNDNTAPDVPQDQLPPITTTGANTA